MAKRPLSLTIIAWLLIAFSLLGLVMVFAMSSNPAITKAVEQMHMSMGMYQAWVALNTIVTLICAYGFLKGHPWSRLLYVVMSVLGIVVGFYTSPMNGVVGLVILLVVAFFLFRENANDWFQARGFMLKREVAPSERR